MNPFKALYYMKENKKRTFSLIFLVSNLILVYLGGIYINSIVHYSLRCNSMYQDFATISPAYGSTQEDFDTLTTRAENLASVSTLLPVNMSPNIVCSSEMGTSMSVSMIIFQDLQGLKTYIDTLHLSIDTKDINPREIIISKALAQNAGIKIGDTFDHNSRQILWLTGAYTVREIIESDKLFAYAIDSTVTSSSYLALRQETPDSPSAIANAQASLVNDFEPYVNQTTAVIATYSTIKSSLNDIFYIYKLLYRVLSILIAIVLAITIQATFIGAYDKRNYEFAVYKALGISRYQILWKICKEVLAIFVCGLLLCFISSILITYLVNTLHYAKLSLGLNYFEWSAFNTTLLCCCIIIIPVLLTRMKALHRIDILNE